MPAPDPGKMFAAKFAELCAKDPTLSHELSKVVEHFTARLAVNARFAVTPPTSPPVVQFDDAAARTWTIDLGDPERVGEALWALVRPGAEAAGLTRDDLFAEFDRKTITGALVALRAALNARFPVVGVRTISPSDN